MKGLKLAVQEHEGNIVFTTNRRKVHHFLKKWVDECNLTQSPREGGDGIHSQSWFKATAVNKVKTMIIQAVVRRIR